MHFSNSFLPSSIVIAGKSTHLNSYRALKAFLKFALIQMTYNFSSLVLLRTLLIINDICAERIAFSRTHMPHIETNSKIASCRH